MIPAIALCYHIGRSETEGSCLNPTYNIAIALCDREANLTV
jgi:hypothetical protein